MRGRVSPIHNLTHCCANNNVYIMGLHITTNGLTLIRMSSLFASRFPRQKANRTITSSLSYHSRRTRTTGEQKHGLLTITWQHTPSIDTTLGEDKTWQSIPYSITDMGQHYLLEISVILPENPENICENIDIRQCPCESGAELE